MSAGNGRPLELSRRARRIEVSPTVAMGQRAMALRAQGVSLLDFSVGEPDQTTPRSVAQVAAQAVTDGHTRYTPSAGIPELRAAVAERYRADFGVAFQQNEVVVTNGGKHALYSACQCLLDPGDEVIVPSPFWPTFADAVKLAGGRPVIVKTREQDAFRLTPGLVRKAVTQKTKALVVNSPSNPTGAVVDPDDLIALGRLAKKHSFVLFYDDTYAQLTFDAPPQPLQRLRDEIGDLLVVLGTSSKTYCMTGWRIGWVLGPKTLADATTALISHSTQCPTSFAQQGAVAALRGPQQFVKDLLEEYRRRRDFLHAELSDIPGVRCVKPAGSFYVFPNLQAFLGGSVKTTLDLARRLLDEQRIAVVPGEGFGSPGYVRISFARSMDELRAGAARIRGFLQGLEKR
jgi:aspartate aminotransferase